MPTYTVYTYQCPRCRADIGRRFGLISTPTIACPSCGARVRIDTRVIQQNWGYNFAWVAGLLAWLALGVGTLASPEFAAMIGRKTFPAVTLQNRMLIAGVCVLPALFIGLLFGGLGMVLGTIVAATASEEESEEGGILSYPSAPPRAPGQQLLSSAQFLPPMPGQRSPPTQAAFGTPRQPSSPPRPPRRGFLTCAFFVLLWPVVFFVAGTSVLHMVATSGVEYDESPAVTAASTVGLAFAPGGAGPLLAASTQVRGPAIELQLQQQAVNRLLEKAVPWLLLGMLVVFVLGCLGLMPVTARRLKPPAAPATDLSGTLQQGVRVPRPRTRLARGFFVLLWPVLFFAVAALVTSALAGAFSEQSQDVRNHIHAHAARNNTGWIFLVSLGLFAVGRLGVLPGTGLWKKTRPTS